MKNPCAFEAIPAALALALAFGPSRAQSLVSNVSTINVLTGGSQILSLLAGPVHGGKVYFVLGSLSGSNPGLTVSGITLPLNPDAYFTYTLVSPNSPPLSGSLGILNALGNATASVVLPPSPAILQGLTVLHAYAVLDPGTLSLLAVSNLVALTLVLSPTNGPLFPYPLQDIGAPSSGASTWSVADMNGDGIPDGVASVLQTGLIPAGDKGRVSVSLGQGDGTYAPATAYAVGADVPKAIPGIVTADFNMDGSLDVAVSTWGYSTSADCTVLLNNGAALLQSSAVYANPDALQADWITVGDADGDGDHDLAFGADQSTTKDVWLLVGSGTGGFSTGPTVNLGSTSGVVEMLDLNSDGQDEFLVVSGSNVLVVPNLGGLAYGPATAYPFTPGFQDIFLAPANADALPDVIVLTQATVDVFLNSGTGGLTIPPVSSPLTGLLKRGAMGDLDGDGDADLAARTSLLSSDTAILMNNGAGVLSKSGVPQLDHIYGSWPKLSDTDRDGDLDLLYRGLGQAQSWFGALKGDGVGGFAAGTYLPTGYGPEKVLVVDLDGAFGLDLLVYERTSSSFSWLLSQPGGGFSSPLSQSVSSAVTDLIAVDLDLDGDNDVAVSNYPASKATLYFNDGAGGLSAAAPALSIGTGPFRIAAADITGDARPDFLVLRSAFNTLSLYENQGGTSFVLQQETATGNEASSLVVADIDGDGNEDVIVSNGKDDTISTYKGTGTGLAAAVVFPAGDEPTHVAVGDLNGQGLLDVVVSNPKKDLVSVLLGSGAWSFGTPKQLPAGDGVSRVEIADLDLDGRRDLVAVNADGTMSVLFGSGGGLFHEEVRHCTSHVAGGLGLADLDGDGDVDVAVSLIYNAGLRILWNSKL